MKRYAFPVNLALWGVLFFLIRWPAWNIIVAVNLTLWMLWWHYLLLDSSKPLSWNLKLAYLIASLILTILGILMWCESLPAFGLVLIWGTASLMGHCAIGRQPRA
jgi:hypothetical protein